MALPPLPDPDREEHAQALAARLLAEASSTYRVRVPRIRVRFDLIGTAAGQVRVLGRDHFLIRFNPDLLARNPEGFLRRTVPHEVAHVVTYCRFGTRAKPHGPEWREAMGLFGAAPDRCHDYDTSGLSRRRLQRFPYRCHCSDHLLTSIRHRRFHAGTAYRCRSCGEALRPGARSRTEGT